MRRFKSMRQAQRLPSMHAPVSNHFRPGSPRYAGVPLSDIKWQGGFASWSEITGMNHETANSV